MGGKGGKQAVVGPFRVGLSCTPSAIRFRCAFRVAAQVHFLIDTPRQDYIVSSVCTLHACHKFFFLHVVAQFISVSVSLLFRMLKQLPSSAVIDLRVPFRTELNSAYWDGAEYQNSQARSWRAHLSVTSFQSPPYELASPDLELDERYPDGETAGVQNASPTSCPTLET